MARVASSVGLKRVKEREEGDEKEKAQMSDESKLFRTTRLLSVPGAFIRRFSLPKTLSLGGLMAALIRRLMDLTMS